MNEIILYSICVFTVASLKMAWFETSLPLHIYHFIHKLFKTNLGIQDWSNIPEFESTWEDWADTLSLSKYPLIAALLTCPVCLSFHLSFWSSLTIFLVSLMFTPVNFVFVPVCLFTIPYIVNKFLK